LPSIFRWILHIFSHDHPAFGDEVLPWLWLDVAQPGTCAGEKLDLGLKNPKNGGVFYWENDD
jgi:hypothetical protein